ncbi:MAG: triose-phosphate isomerase [Candidatus Nitrosocaldus sp.]|nr:triose-phosphate isomerase [Candidatus Nitrosocaldus sp.]MDW8275545.1 triose-phosphate isomerase [Candidatus Nitrosocaldus sp.]
MREPILIINLKNYMEASGRRCLALALEAERVARDLNIPDSIALAPPNPALAWIAEHVSIPVIAQHVDDRVEGSTTGYNVASVLKTFNIKGSLVNHSEHRLTLKEIGSIVSMLRSHGMLSIVCVREPDEIDAIAGFEPDYIAIEPPELIGSGNAVSRSRPEVITGSIERVAGLGLRSRVICGAGIVDGRDASAAIRLGSRGVLVASGIVKASNWYERIREIVTGMLQHLAR